ncbi:MAG: HAMP domain-containing histidine kinase [Deltaproteobacteria bacterium]|nr:HAMP domain-containing histidine kinase [Deltaproteobacteria bacterium]
MKKTLVAAGLLVVALAALLIAWFTSGWADVRARQETKRAAPTLLAETRGAELAQELRSELSRLLSREIERPYFHYQSLMRDPRASRGTGVTPSPLASGPEDKLVMGYFQLDTKGRTTTPTINDDVPELSEPKQLAGNLQFRGEVIRSLSPQLAPVAIRGEVVARNDAPEQPPRIKRPPPPPPVAPQVITLDNDSYTQNNFSNQIYQGNLPSQAVVPSQAEVTPTPPVPAPPKPVPRPRPATPPAPVALPAAVDAITIIVSPLEWSTLPFAGIPTLVAVREVATPDGALAQGFVVDRASLTSFLAASASDSIVELRADPDHSEPRMQIAPGWHLAVRANPRSIAAAAAEASQIGSAFLLRFILIGIIAAIAAAFVVWLVARAEILARERSQFAAAAAHELRTPLAGLQLYGDMLADGLGDPAKQRDYARRMSEEAARLGRVVSNVLGFSQLERGNLSVDPKVARLDEELRRLCERAEPALDRAGAALALDVAPELSAKFDRDALARIVGNLLDNAEKYGRDAEDRTIGLSARKAADGVEIVVTDHGPGIAPQARAKLFRPFTRGVTADGPAGLGLGLALSQSLARAMGGDLQYRATAGGGAEFVLRLAGA